MKEKRVLVASFILIIVGLFFILNFEGNITGAAVGVSKAMDPGSNFLFGFFLVWLAGILLIGSADVSLEDKIRKEDKKSKPFNVDDFLKDFLKKNPNLHTEIDEYGDIVIPIGAHDRVISKCRGSQALYVYKDKEYLKIESPKGKMYKREAFSNFKNQIIMDYLKFISEDSKLNLNLKKIYKGKVLIREAELPFKKYNKGIAEYVGRAIETKDDGELVVIDKNLKDSEKLATTVHELIHTTGINKESEAQLKTIEVLKSMYNTYDNLMKRECDWPKWFESQGDPDIIKKETIKNAYLYAIKSRKSFNLTLKDIKNRLDNSKNKKNYR